MKYHFPKPLIKGLITSRPNRFIMMVKIGNKLLKCHCPSTGRIGNIIFSNIPCLISKSEGKNRKTAYTVEAVSLDQAKAWIGINQVKINRYIEYFLKQNQFLKMIKIKAGTSVKREKMLGNSRIDFLIGGDYLEIKMPLISLPTKEKIKYQVPTKFNSFDRLIKHFKDLTKNLKNKNRAIIALCYMYDAEPFKAPTTDKSNSKIKKAAERAINKGVEQWQINLKIDKNGVSLIRYFKLNPF